MEPLSVGHHDEQEADGKKEKEDLWINGYVFPSPRMTRMMLYWTPMIVANLGIIVVMWCLFLSPSYKILDTYTRSECEVVFNSRAYFISRDSKYYYRNNLVVFYTDMNGMRQNATGSACDSTKPDDVRCSQKFMNDTRFSCLYLPSQPGEILVTSFYTDLIYSTKLITGISLAILFAGTILMMALAHFCADMPVYQRHTDITTQPHLWSEVEELQRITSVLHQSFFIFLIKEDIQTRLSKGGVNNSRREVITLHEEQRENTIRATAGHTLCILTCTGLDCLAGYLTTTMLDTFNISGVAIAYGCGVFFVYLAWLSVLSLLRLRLFRRVKITTNARTMKWSGSWLFGYKREDLYPWEQTVSLEVSDEPQVQEKDEY